MVRKISVVLSVCLLLCCLLAGCGTKPSKSYEGDFNLDTGEMVVVAVDKDSGYHVVRQSDGFLLSAKSGSEADVTGAFLSSDVANNVAVKFRSEGSYGKTVVDGREGYSFQGTTDDGKTVYGCIVPCSEDGISYLELLSTVSEDSLLDAMEAVHVSVS